MDAPRQLIMKRIGESGCYLLCLVYLGERLLGRRVDAVEVYERATQMPARNSTTTQYYAMGEDCYIYDLATVMELICGEAWTVRKAEPEEPAGPQELEVLRFERRTTAGLLSHFVVGDGSGRVAYDPYGESLTVASGYLASKRLLRRA